MDTKVTIAGVELKNPVMTASGTFGSGMEYTEFVDLNRLGAIVTKGVASVPWEGNPTPRVTETPSGMLNAIGLQNPGVDVFIKRDGEILASGEYCNGKIKVYRDSHLEKKSTPNHYLIWLLEKENLLI